MNIETYKPFDDADRAIAYLHMNHGWSPEKSLDNRRKGARAELKKVRRFERKTEPYRSRWLEQVARIEAMVKHFEMSL